MGNEVTKQQQVREEISRSQAEILRELQRLRLATQNQSQSNGNRQGGNSEKAGPATITPKTPSARTSCSSFPGTSPAYTPMATTSNAATGMRTPNQPAAVQASAPPLNEASSVSQENRPPQPYNFTQNELERLTRSERLYPDFGGWVGPLQRSTHLQNPAPPQNSAPSQSPAPPQRPAPTQNPAPSQRSACSDGFVVISRDGTVNEDSVAPIKQHQQASGKQEESSLSCSCCRQRLRGAPLYQCSGGHSACASCRAAARTCGVCARPVTDMRSFALEVFIAQMKIRCSNANRGCKRLLTMDEEEEHARECPFGDLRCPASASTPCAWTGKASMLAHHFEHCHPELCAVANAERTLPGSLLRREHTAAFLLTVGACHFVLRVEVAGGSVRVKVQFLGTSFNANKWIYELHVYNKAEPRRKYFYSDSCSAISAPVVPCAELADAYVTSFLNHDELVYKVFVRKRDGAHDGDREPPLCRAREPSFDRARRPHSRQRPYKNKPFQKQ